VKWSKDPEAKRRQLDYIIDGIGKASFERWRGYFDDIYSGLDPADFLHETGGADEVEIVPF